MARENNVERVNLLQRFEVHKQTKTKIFVIFAVLIEGSE